MSSGELRQRRFQTNNKESDTKQSQIDAEKNFSRGWVYPFLAAVGVSFAVMVLIVILMPSPIDYPHYYTVSEPQELTGALGPNNILHNAERIYENQLSGPESMAIDGDYLYTGCADGWVKVVHKGEVRNLVRFGKGPCGGVENENTCGRPLGMRLDKDGFLLVLDAYYGLFRVNVVTGDYTTLLSSETVVEGSKSHLLNDLDIAADGKIYFTDSTSKFTRNQLHFIFTECKPDGRLMVYDPKTKKTSVVWSGLQFPNGVQFNKDKTALLVAETTQGRILKYELASGKKSVWADNLPCIPDNIRYHKLTATYWVGCAFARQKGTSLIDKFAPYPIVRAVAAKFVTYYNFNYVLAKFAVEPFTIAIEINESGQTTRTLQDRTGKVIQGCSEIESANGVLYIGSWRSHYLGRLNTKHLSGN